MSTIQLRTPIPGPRSQALMKRRNAAVVQAAYHATPVFIAKAEGAVVEDVDGNRLIDFAGGIGCLNTGHRAPAVVEAVRRQLDRFLHTSFNVLPYESYVAVCEKLNAIVPGKGPKKTLLVNTGAEATENAIKIARAYTRRPAIIAFEDAFHGRTYMAMAMTSKTHPYKAGFEPFPAEVYRIPYAYCYRCSYSLKYPSCEVYCATAHRRYVQASGGGRDGGGRDCRADSRRRRIRYAAARVLSDADRDLPQARHPRDRRRSADRIRAHRRDVRLRATGT